MIITSIYDVMKYSLTTKMVWTLQEKAFCVVTYNIDISPDLSPLDFYLWGFLKSRVYKDNPQSIPELKQAIVDSTRRIPREQVIKVIDNFVKRVKTCRQRGGAHIEHVL